MSQTLDLYRRLAANRRSVQNHIGTLHALAIANGLEAAMGLVCEASVPQGMLLDSQGDSAGIHREGPR